VIGEVTDMKNKKFMRELAEKSIPQLRKEIVWLKNHIKARELVLLRKERNA